MWHADQPFGASLRNRGMSRSALPRSIACSSAAVNTPLVTSPLTARRHRRRQGFPQNDDVMWS
jgi:hypothetical protein